jgi:nitroimidazol reductase NimA-like FMN-containing flavoprotein (pyridoxamine 5'-phosphate oxidase superfamily)
VAHVAILDGDQPYVVPLAFARDAERMLVHGSTASRAFRTLAGGAATCATVTVVDGMVVARSQFESSMRYRSAMVLGAFRPLHDGEKARALQVLAARLLPGLDGARPPSDQEMRATSVLALPLDEWSLKVSAGHPEDADGDLDRPVWAGVVPLHHTWGAPEAAPDLDPGIAVPPAVATWPAGRS